MFEMSAFGSNKLASVLTIGQLHHQSATTPGCTTQLRNVRAMRGLPLPIRRSSKPVSCNFLNNFFISFRFQFLLRIPESVTERHSLLLPISFFKLKSCLLQYHFEKLTSYLLRFT